MFRLQVNVTMRRLHLDVAEDVREDAIADTLRRGDRGPRVPERIRHQRLAALVAVHLQLDAQPAKPAPERVGGPWPAALREKDWPLLCPAPIPQAHKQTAGPRRDQDHARRVRVLA